MRHQQPVDNMGAPGDTIVPCCSILFITHNNTTMITTANLILMARKLKFILYMRSYLILRSNSRTLELQTISPPDELASGLGGGGGGGGGATPFPQSSAALMQVKKSQES